jgi:hypothetical protein
LQGTTEGLELGLVHFDEMTRLREVSGLDIGDVFRERSNALLLEAAIFGKEVSVGLGVTREAFVVFAEEVVGEEELCVAT